MFHHVAVASKDVKKSHKFYTEAMGFTLKKIVKRGSPEGGWTKHIFYDTGEGQLFAIWDLHGIEGVVIEPDQWQGGMGNGLPYWINHVAFDCHDIGGLERCKQRWLDLGYNVAEVKHEFIHSIYTRDPDGTLVEFTFDTQPLTEADEREAAELLADDNPTQEPDYEAVQHRSPHYQARRAAEKEQDLGDAVGDLTPDPKEQAMADSHQRFFEELDWFNADHCARLDDELTWARAECPVVHTNFNGGMHVVTRYDDLRTVAEHPEIFSSTTPGVGDVPVALPPLDLDPPLHREFRSFLNRPFSRSSLLRYQPVIEKLADDLIDGFISGGRVEFVGGFAIPFTSGSLAKVVLDDDNEERLRRAVDAVTGTSVEQSPETFGRVAAIAAELMAERENDGKQRDDFLQSLVDAKVEGGRPLTQMERLGVVTVLLLGGLDTTRGALTYIGRFLAEEPGLEERLRRPDWTKRDLDELLRFTSTVSVMGRLVTQDNGLLGVPLKAGDRLAVHWRSGNRDEVKFARAGQLDFDRERNPHAAFGIGIHRCVGQHFARLQLEIAVNRLLARLTGFRVAAGTTVREAVGVSIKAPEELHLEFDRVPAAAAVTAAYGQE